MEWNCSLEPTSGAVLSLVSTLANDPPSFCVDSSGEDVEIEREGAESETHTPEPSGSATTTPHGENCHFHAGVE